MSLTPSVVGREYGFDLVDYAGFTNARLSQWTGATKLSDLSERERPIHAASYLCGPLAEYRWHALVADALNEQVDISKVEELVRGGLRDFQCASGCSGEQAYKFGMLCLMLHRGCAIEHLPRWADRETVDRIAHWVALADRVLDAYFAQILAYKDVLSRADGLLMSQSQAQQWAEQAFVKVEIGLEQSVIQAGETPRIEARCESALSYAGS